MIEILTCLHCLGEVALRNPAGNCDHLYYPENCQVCQRIRNAITESQLNRDKEWCQAIINQQIMNRESGRLVVDVEQMLKYFNFHRKDVIT